MKNVVIILLILVLAVVGFIYYNNQNKATPTEPAPTTTSTVDRPKTTTTKPKPQPKTPAKPVTANLTLPDQGTYYVNGKGASGSIEVPIGKVTVSAFDGSRYSHQVLDLKEGETGNAVAPTETDQASDSWNQFQGDKLRCGFAKTHARENLTLVWNADLGSKVKSSPIVVADQAILSPANALLMTIQLKDGSIDWREGLTGSSITPITTNLLAFAAADSGHFRAHLLKNGKMRGEKFLESYATSLGLIDENAFLVTTKDNKIYAIRTKRNFIGSVPLKVLWENVINEFWKGASTPVILEDRAIYHSFAEGLIAIDLETGKKLWPTNSGATGEETLQQQGIVEDDGNIVLNFTDQDHFLTPTPASDGSTVFAVTDSGVGAVSAQTGKTLWKANLGTRVTSSVSMAYGLLYFGTNDGYLMAVSSKDGSPAFKAKVGEKAIFSSPIVFSGQVMIGTAEGKVMLCNAFSGDVIAEDASLKGTRITATPAVANAGILVINEAGKAALYQ